MLCMKYLGYLSPINNSSHFAIRVLHQFNAYMSNFTPTQCLYVLRPIQSKLKRGEKKGKNHQQHQETMRRSLLLLAKRKISIQINR